MPVYGRRTVPVTPATPPPPKKFRRGERVRIHYADPKRQTPHSCHGRLGTVVNAERECWSEHATGKWHRMVSVRLDSQHPYEKGYVMNEQELVADCSGRFEFERRHYNIHCLTHDQLALLRDCLEGDMRPEAAELLKRLPKLPE